MEDYISREAAIELLSQPITMSMCLSTDECHHKIAQQRIDRYLIESIPAAGVRPVVRGKWEEKEKDGVWWYACSVCGEHIPKGQWGQEWHSRFCPNCGADMRRKADV